MLELNDRGQTRDPSQSLTRELKDLLKQRDARFWQLLSHCTNSADSFEELYFLSTLRRKANVQGFSREQQCKDKVKLALLGGYTFYPLTELIEHNLFINEFDSQIWTGDYDNYRWEITDEKSSFYDFAPNFILFFPPARRYKYSGRLTDPSEEVEKEIAHHRQDILNLCELMHNRSGSEIILCNFIPPCTHDPGQIRTRKLGTDWSFLKRLNSEIGLHAPNYVHILDLEFLSARLGSQKASDDRSWFESKQPFSADFACHVATEVLHLVQAAKRASKKVLVLDLDNTLWGGVIGDDGINGIDIGDISSRGQCFKEFQRSIKELSERGVLLAVCSKNDLENAIEPFEKHPDMVLRKEDFVSFKANWNPKSENIIAIAQELNLGLDSFVFVDDNPAEIEIVRQFVPQVETILLGEDPSTYPRLLRDCRFFEPTQITEEDFARTSQYRQENERQALLSSTTDMEGYLRSLEMVAQIDSFLPIDVPRISQLINKSNQFNLTTKRRTEAEVSALVEDGEYECFSVRLKDKFGDLGLVSVVIAKQEESTIVVDTWLMSCRVLKRGVEQVAMNELMKRARSRGCETVIGTYIPSAKNQMVRDFYQSMGFEVCSQNPERVDYKANASTHSMFETEIAITRSSDG